MISLQCKALSRVFSDTTVFGTSILQHSAFFMVGHRENEIMPFAATWIDLEIIMLTKVSQKKKYKYHMISVMWNLKYDTNKHI